MAIRRRIEQLEEKLNSDSEKPIIILDNPNVDRRHVKLKEAGPGLKIMYEEEVPEPDRPAPE